MLLTSAKWWKAAGIRALKTAAQAFIATVGAAVVISDVNWGYVVSASLLAAILSLVTSLAGLPELEVNPNEANVLETYDFENEPADVAEVDEIG